ncbi:MAG: tetratricopeptide repeat protein [Pseudomonadota bacterium]
MASPSATTDTEANREALAGLIAAVAGDLGFDANKVAKRLSGGASIGEALDLPAGTVPLIYARAHAAFQAGRVARAEQLFRVLTMLDGGNPDHWLGYAICLRQTGQQALARDLFNIAATLDPQSAVPHFHLAELALSEDDVPAAKAAAEACTARGDKGLPTPIKGEMDRYRAAIAARS